MMKMVLFVVIKSGWMRVLDLFDFREELLKKLFVGEDVFFVEMQYIDFVVFVVFERFGMKKEKMIVV